MRIIIKPGSIPLNGSGLTWLLPAIKYRKGLIRKRQTGKTTEKIIGTYLLYKLEQKIEPEPFILETILKPAIKFGSGINTIETENLRISLQKPKSKR